MATTTRRSLRDKVCPTIARLGDASAAAGAFRDEIAAGQAYDEAARGLFGEHARLNFPQRVDCWLERKAA